MERATIKIIFSLLVLHHVIAAPSDVKLEEIAEVTRAETEEKLDSQPATLLDTTDETAQSQSPRQKRWYDFYGGFPPFTPSFFNRENAFNPAVIPPQDPLVNIHRRLLDITNTLRQPPPPNPQFPPQFQPQFPPGFPHFPAFVPILYIPQVGCSCGPDGTQNSNDNRGPQDNQNSTDPNVMSRWPDMEDERQNWGIVTNGTTNTQEENGDDGDGSRPISFDPIRPSRPMNRPAPPVEHGTVEGDVSSVNADSASTTTFRPPAQAPGSTGPPLPPPTSCDSAILKCCLLPQVTYDCFALEGCPDPSAYGYPCENGVISRVIDRFLRYYSQRNG